MGNLDWVRIVLRSIIPSSIELPGRWIASSSWIQHTSRRLHLMEDVIPSLYGGLCASKETTRAAVHPVMQCHDMVIKDQYTCAKSEQVIRDNGFQVNDSPHHSKLSNVPLRGPIMSPHLSKTTYPLCLPRMSRWPTPMKGKFLIRWYCADTDGVQPVPQAGAVAVMSEAEIAANDDDSNLEVIYLPTDFDWHRHIAMGTFLYRGCVLRINSTPLLQYVSQNTMMELRAIYGDPSGKSEWFVKDIAKGHISSLMDSLDEFHSQGLCIEELDRSKVVICDGIAKFSADIRLILANDDRRTANWVKLEGIISDTLFEGRESPYSMKHLLLIMRTQPLTSVTYMKSHVGLLRQVNKTAAFMRLYDSLHALRLQDESQYWTLISFLPYRHSWYAIMSKNTLLASLIKGRFWFSSRPEILVQCYRGLSYHKMDDSVDPVTGEVLYTQEMFEDVLDSDLPEFLTELQFRLFIVGRHDLTQVDSLLPHSTADRQVTRIKMQLPVAAAALLK